MFRREVLSYHKPSMKGAANGDAAITRRYIATYTKSDRSRVMEQNCYDCHRYIDIPDGGYCYDCARRRGWVW